MTNALLTFIGAQELARQKTVEGKKDWPSYVEWLIEKQKQYERMPSWYWNEYECKSMYVQRIETKLAMETKVEAADAH